MTKLAKKKLNIFFSGLMMMSDFVVVFLSFTFSYWLRFYSGFFLVPLGIPSYQSYILPVFFTSLILIMALNADGLYRFNPVKKFIDHVFKLSKNVCITMFLIFAGTFFYKEFNYSRSLIFILWMSLALYLALTRYILRVFYMRYILPRVRRKILIIGNPQNIKFLEQFRKYFKLYGQIIGFIAPRRVPEPCEVKCLGTIGDFQNILHTHRPDEVILASLEIPRRKIIELILESEKHLVHFKIVADLLEIMIQQFELENVEGLNLIKIKESPLNFAYNRFLKRIMDLSGALFGLIILAPLLLVIALLVKISSRGPVFFVQERMGEEGRIFKIYKFRTMVHNAETNTGPVFASRDDERCTNIGGYFRRYNLDELPQLFNVLRGEMSLVGPRPERPHFVEQFKDDVPRYMSRHHVKSGITGWAQVNGLRQGTPIKERIRYDLFYLENWSVWFDLKIIILSFFALKNAY